MKRTIVWLLALVMVTMVQAEEITSQQALEQAQRFLQERATRANRAKGTTPQLTMTKQVSGLYVFNMADNQGYVIVSNDDRVLPILGFSDSGNLDPDRMPSNMRAWLQGYADQIAWAKEHQTFTVLKTSAAPATRRAGSHSTAAIAPLVTTKWNQDTPFNDLCPEYTSGRKSATGCVATAMAQVMKYHEWPQSATSSIPAYKTKSYGLTVSALPATIFDWGNMVDEYNKHWNGSYFVKISSPTDAQATAVATLMQYCGSSIKMDYGPESGANTNDVAEALKNYFDYNASTTQFVSRSFYTTAKWADLIYHELANKRPVVYGGTSSGGGHEFVCDGYKYESSTDFFHINWGWGGMSDDYFVLSALDPDAQGIGGSTSTDGYHFGQDAVIGIQKSTENGAVADITPNVINLKLNSMTPASNQATRYEPLNVTLNFTNNSKDDYDGDIYLGFSDNGYFLLEGNNFVIPAGQTKDIVIPFIPTSLGTYNLVLFLPNDEGSYSTNTKVYASVTVSDASINEYVPIYGYYCDELVSSQFVIPAANMDDEMANSTLNSVTFYASTLSAVNWGAAEFDVYLKEVSETALSSLTGWNTMEKVYSGSLSIGSDGKMEIAFDTPYQYDGGNLLIGFNQTKSGGYKQVNWVGANVSGASLGGKSTTTTQRNFLPKTTFDYTPGVGSTPKPKNVAVKPLATSAKVTWTGYADSYEVSYGKVPEGSVVADPTWLKYDDGSWMGNLGSSTSSTRTWGVMYPGSQVNGNKLTKVSWYETMVSDVTVKIYSGGDNAPGTLLYNANITPEKDGEFHEVTLPTPIAITSGENLWITLTTTGSYTMPLCASNEPNNQWVYNGDAWVNISDLGSSLSDYGWMIRAYIEADAINEEEVDWKTITSSTASCKLTGLTPETSYLLKVRGDFGTYGYSDWTAVTSFTTTDSAVLLGDVNNDGQVTISDAVGIVNYILGNPAAGFNDAAADVNGDGSITITDAVGVVNIILKGE